MSPLGRLNLEPFPDLSFVVDDQVTEGDRVASRWTLRGTHRGRSVTLRGIVIKRIQLGAERSLVQLQSPRLKAQMRRTANGTE